MGYVDTLIAHHTSYDPETLSDARWAEVFKQLGDILKQEAAANKTPHG